LDVIGIHKDLTIAEKRVLSWLEKGLADEPGRIFVEMPMKMKFKKFNRWPDFIIVSPLYGVCIVECKGYMFDEIKSYSPGLGLETVSGTDAYQRQMRDYGILLRELLQGKDVQRSKVVVFPRLHSYDKRAHSIRELSEGDLTHYFEDDLYQKCSLSKLLGPPMAKKMKSSEFQELIDLINPIRVFDHNYGLDLDETNKRVMSFDPKQMSYIDRMQDGHYLINGLPGTGKTKMLEAIAQREILKGKSVLYACFNRPLKDSVEEVLGEDYVATTHQLYHKLVEPYGINYKSDKKWVEKAIPLLVEKKLEPLYDVLLLDEYQDLTDEDYQILLKLLKPKGLLVLAGDQLQNIRGSSETWKSKGIKISGRSLFLSAPYRTCPSVVDFALKFVCSRADLKKIVERYFKESKFRHQFGSFSRLEESIRLFQLNKQGFNIELGKIIEENPLAKILVITNSYSVDLNLPQSKNKRVRIEPYSRVKGLEADIVVLYNLDQFQEASSKMQEAEKMKALFSALCRARGVVYVHGFEAKGYYEELREIYLECMKEKVA
jgi:hypothetical protein